MKALSLYQPWASLVALGEKRVETRSWPTLHRGLLAIHAGAQWTQEQRKLAYHTEPFREVLARHHVIPTQRYGMTAEHIQLGAIVAICWLTRCVQITPGFTGMLSEQEIAFGDYAPGRYAWILDNIQRLPEPMLCPGHQRLWNWSERIVGPGYEIVREAIKVVTNSLPEDHLWELSRGRLREDVRQFTAAQRKRGRL